MKITHYICPRRCGKTTKAKEMQMEDPENILLFTGQWSSGRSFRGVHLKKIILDDFIDRFYLECTNKESRDKFIEWFWANLVSTLEKDGEIVLFSTPTKRYTQEQILLASLIEYPQYLKNFGVLELDKIKEVIQEINNNFLNPSKVNIIKTDFNTPFARTNESKKELKMSLGEIVYKLEVEGEFIL